MFGILEIKKHGLVICFAFGIFLCLPLNAQPFGDRYNVDSAMGLEMIWVNVHTLGKPTTYSKGSPLTEPGRLTDENLHQVTLSKEFYLGKHEVTQAEYEAVMRDNPYGLDARPSNFSQNENQPVESISWNEISVFLYMLNEKERNAGRLPDNWEYSLPTEAQWEFACRAGSSNSFSSGNQITALDANFLPNNLKKTKVVGSFSSNQWGFYDMHGNVKEWCSDWYTDDYEGSYCDPSGPVYSLDLQGNYRQATDYFYFTSDMPEPIENPSKVLKGGAFDSDANGVRSARRYHELPDQKFIDSGFRLALKKIQSDASLAYSLVGNEVTVVSGDRVRAETFWGDTGASVSLDASPEKIAASFLSPHVDFADEIVVTPLFIEGSGSITRPNQDLPSQYDPVPESGYFVEVYQSNNVVHQEKVTLEELNNFMDNHSPTFSKFSYDYNEQSPLALQSPSHGLVALFADSFSGPSPVFLDEGNYLVDSPGWRWVQWFGYFYADSFPWIYHENLGWIYVSQSQLDRAWVYRENLGWAWTSSQDWWVNQPSSPDPAGQNHFPFPYLYRYGIDENDSKAWTYLDPSNSDTVLYDFEEKKWFSLDTPYHINTSIFPTDGGTIDGNGTYYHWHKVSLSAIPSVNFKFLQWSGDQASKDVNISFVASGNKTLNAIFLPEASSSLSPEEKTRVYREVLSARDDLTSQQKEWALTELLYLGKSPTAGIP